MSQKDSPMKESKNSFGKIVTAGDVEKIDAGKEGEAKGVNRKSTR
jgi:hypothetical protein